MTCHGPLTALAKATTPMAVVLVAACAGGQEARPADSSPSPPTTPSAVTTTAPTTNASSPTCDNRNRWRSFAWASPQSVRDCLDAGARLQDMPWSAPIIFWAARLNPNPGIIDVLVAAGAGRAQT